MGNQILMSMRITKKWTASVKEAYGDNPQTQKGMKAEEIVYEYLKSIYDFVTWNVDDSKEQKLGNDFEFSKKSWKKHYTVDVKGNLQNRTFLVYIDEIKNKKNHRMLHIDPSTGWAVEYDRSSMVNYITNNPQLLRTDKNHKQYFVGTTYNSILRNKIAFFRVFLINVTPKKNKEGYFYKLSKTRPRMTEDDYISRLNRTWYENYE
jgi:hypothetical protein